MRGALLRTLGYPHFVVRANRPLTFDASASNSSNVAEDQSEATIVSYVWSFGDGTTATGLRATHRFHRRGVYVPRLTITDSVGATSHAYVARVEVGCPPSTPPWPPRCGARHVGR